MNNISINSQPQTPHEEAKIIKVNSSRSHYLTKIFNGTPSSKADTANLRDNTSKKIKIKVRLLK